MATGEGRAKIVILGEHFCVYGGQAIGAALDKIIEIEIKKSAAFEIGFAADKKTKMALEVLRKLTKTPNFKIGAIKSEIPPASGLGFSAAFSVAAVRAISNEFHLDLTDRRVCDFSFAAEKIFHGSPSGIDNTLAAFGGAIVFQKKPKGNLIRPLRIGSPLHLLLIDSGVKSGTKIMVDKVGAFKKQNEKIFTKLLEAESLIVARAIDSIKKGDLRQLGALMNVNHGLLGAIGVSHVENERIVALARKHGALGAKIAGAGGGGFCVALMKNKASALALARKIKRIYECFYSEIPAN